MKHGGVGNGRQGDSRRRFGDNGESKCWRRLCDRSHRSARGPGARDKDPFDRRGYALRAQRAVGSARVPSGGPRRAHVTEGTDATALLFSAFTTTPANASQKAFESVLLLARPSFPSRFNLLEADARVTRHPHLLLVEGGIELRAPRCAARARERPDRSRGVSVPNVLSPATHGRERPRGGSSHPLDLCHAGYGPADRPRRELSPLSFRKLDQTRIR